MSNPSDCALHRALIAGALVLFTCGSAGAHHGPRPEPEPAPASTTAVAMFTGTIALLIVENRVTNITARHVALRMDDGHLLALRGMNVESLAEGARVRASGRVSAKDTLWVAESKVVSAPSARSLAHGHRVNRRCRERWRWLTPTISPQVRDRSFISYAATTAGTCR